VKRTVISALAALTCTLVMGLGATAAQAATSMVPASVNSTILFTGPANAGGITDPVAECATPLASCTDSMAGYFTNSFGQTFNRVDGTFTLNPEAEGIGISTVAGLVVGGVTETSTSINGAIGLQICNETTGEAAQLGAVYLGDSTGTPLFALGYLTGYLNSLTVDPCVGGGVLGGASSSTTFTALTDSGIPAGSTIRAQIQEYGGAVLFTAALANGVANYTYFDSACRWFFPNEAGAGLQVNTTGLSAPASNDLTDFTGVTATSDGVTHGFAFWNAVQVQGSQDGIAPALLSPNNSISPAVATRTWIPGHRYYYGPKGHRHYRWIGGHWTSSGLGASSFSVDAGTPVS
jgi:hypothetical protein